MDADQGEMYRQCARKLEIILSKKDCDLRIVVGHSNMLQSLMTAVILQYDDENNNDNEWEAPGVSNPECEAEPNPIPFSEPVEELFPLSNEVSITEMELRSDEGNDTYQVQQFHLENSHIVMTSALPV